MSILAHFPNAKTVAGHWIKFKASTNLLRHCPVLDGAGNLVSSNPIPGIHFGRRSNSGVVSGNLTLDVRGDPLKSFDYKRYTQAHRNIADIIGRELPPFVTTVQ